MLKGFTLAEILIALVIIGVIAALTVPILLNYTDDKELISEWKKSYSVIAKATMALNQDFDGVDLSSSSAMRQSYANVLSYGKEGYFHDLAESQYKYYKNESTTNVFNMDNAPSVTLQDGAVVSFYYATSDCGWNPSGLAVCGLMYVDVNAKKRPNMFGKDLYGIWLIKNSGNYYVYPQGSHDDNMTCSVNSQDWYTSAGCASYVLLNDQLLK